jgi:hypothetical protein
MPTSVEVLRASVEAHNDTFETLLNLIPAKYYLAKDGHNADDNVRCLNFQSSIDESTRRTGSVQVSKTQQKQEGAQTSCEGGIKKGS